ncbi:MAG: SRPBCC family protein [Thermoleophilaceae bacterium]
MKLEQTFQVQAPIQQVWEALIDVERVAPCLPGAEITEAADGKFKGNFTVKLGPTTAAYRGEMEMESVDESSHTVTMRASGQDKRGQGGARAVIVSELREEGGGTAVDVVTDFTITGRLARFGRGGMIKDISNKLLKDFSSCLAEHIEAPAGSGPAPDAAPAADLEASQPAAEAFQPADPGPSGAPVGVEQPKPKGAVRVGSSAASIPPAPAPMRPAGQRKPVNGLALFLSVLRDRLKHLLGR